ncbi:MAG: hypothetical protein CBB97_11685 [Candidatus Endolissoclinum sp. TMED37]|nr:MAG: hypothetical protein CBB97_11685 [Candidatus Endolissoclinum sp. TMED37]
MATIQNLLIDQGTTFTLTVDMTNLDGSTKDLTEYTVAAQLRKSYQSNTFTAFTCSHNNTGGEITMSLTAAQTTALKPGRYVYDLEATSSEETLRVIEGIVTITPEVTR